MIGRLSARLCALKRQFRAAYTGDAGIAEIVPSTGLGLNPEILSDFALHNPIYHNSHDTVVLDTDCTVYEGDINRYWLASITNPASKAPFSPTWLSSALLLASHVQSLGYDEVVDVGSGDGRIAYCAQALGMQAYSIELDAKLADLQTLLASDTGVDFQTICADAVRYEYKVLTLSNPAFFIGGLAQMGGDIMASGILRQIRDVLSCGVGFVFAGTSSKKYVDDGHAGWSKVIHDNALVPADIITLPTAWTFNEPDDTPYVFARFL